jgi:hypothetical protein
MKEACVMAVVLPDAGSLGEGVAVFVSWHSLDGFLPGDLPDFQDSGVQRSRVPGPLDGFHFVPEVSLGAAMRAHAPPIRV